MYYSQSFNVMGHRTIPAPNGNQIPVV